METPIGLLTYQPEKILILKDTYLAAIAAVENGLEHARSVLSKHDEELGRTTRQNATWAKTIEADIRQMERTLEMLRAEPHTSFGT